MEMLIGKLKRFQPRLLPSCILALIAAAASLYLVLPGTVSGFPEGITYIVYVASACGCTCAVWAIILSWRAVSPIAQIKKLASRWEFTHRLVTDRSFRVVSMAYLSLAANILFAAMKGSMGVALRSSWFGVLAGYYIILCLTRFFLILSSRKRASMPDHSKRMVLEWKSFRFSGLLLLLATLFLLGAVLHMIYAGKGYSYQGTLIFVVALYDFWCLINTIIYMIRNLKEHGPLEKAIKTIGFATSLVSILSLQSAMFASFGSDTPLETQRFMNAMTGTSVCLIILLIGIYMLALAQSRLKKLHLGLPNKNDRI